jgi:hypothetical protein
MYAAVWSRFVYIRDSMQRYNVQNGVIEWKIQYTPYGTCEIYICCGITEMRLCINAKDYIS